MADVLQTLTALASERPRDPLAPVTIIAPSHAAALQLRRRLAEQTAFAAVRFETLPRLAELLGAGHLAAAGRLPLARPIGDYVAQQVAAESQGSLGAVARLPGYARVLRRIFRRLRRGGITSSRDITVAAFGRGHPAEILRLYDLFRQRTARFYDDEDLLEAAADALSAGGSGTLGDLGALYLVPPGALTHAGSRLVAALGAQASGVEPVDEMAAAPRETFLIAPDPPSEVREAVRFVIEALEGGIPLHEIAVFHGAASEYGKMLREAFAAASVPAVPLPGMPLIETRAGRGVMLLAQLPEKDFSRTAAMEFLTVAPLRDSLPDGDGVVRALTTAWDKASRDAGITRGAPSWQDRLDRLIRDSDVALQGLDHAADELRIRAIEFNRDQAGALRGVVGHLHARLAQLLEPQPAERFIDAFKRVVREYFSPGAEGLEEVQEEIDQLGTVGAVGGSFNLSTFAEALRANLELAYLRPNSLGNGVVIGDYRIAPGMRFQRCVICGAFEGAFPAGPGVDALLDDSVWRDLKVRYPFIEDAQTRMQQASDAARRAVAAAGSIVTWSTPAYEPGGTREYYPSPLMAAAFSRRTGALVTASQLRRQPSSDGVLTQAPSPLAMMLRGSLLDSHELSTRAAVLLRQRGLQAPPDHPRQRGLQMLAARRSGNFSEWGGNLNALADRAWLELQKAVSPTSLENYAACGYRYFCQRLLRLNVVQEPEERQMMDAATRGELIHRVLERFFIRQNEQGRPGVGEQWSNEDTILLLALADEELALAQERGLTGIDVYAAHEARTIKSDLRQFVAADNLFRLQTGAVPVQFETEIPESQVAGARLRGRVDRIDRTPDGRRAWVIDYKTGSSRGFEKMEEDPLQSGRKLQLPTYLAAAQDAEEAEARYWFITQRGGFEAVPYRPDSDRDARFEATVTAIVDGIRAGAFPAVPGEEDDFSGKFENCRFCDFDRICSRRRDMEYVGSEGHPSMKPWLAVAEAAGGPGK